MLHQIYTQSEAYRLVQHHQQGDVAGELDHEPHRHLPVGEAAPIRSATSSPSCPAIAAAKRSTWLARAHPALRVIKV